MKKIIVITGLFLCCNLQKAQATCCDCHNQWLGNMYANDVMFYNEVLECVPMSGGNGNIGLDDWVAIFTEGYNALFSYMNAEAALSLSLAFMSMADDFWQCHHDASELHNQADALLFDTYYDCAANNGCALPMVCP